MKGIPKGISVLILCSALLLSVPVEAYASGPIIPDHDVTLDIEYGDGDEKIANVTFELYYVATVDPYVHFTSTGAFSSFSIGEPDEEGWRALTVKLQSFVEREHVKPLDSGRTDKNGILAFPTSDAVVMKSGLYLVIGQKKNVGAYEYTVAPFLICLPNSNLKDNTWDYSVIAYPKYSKEHMPEPTNTTSPPGPVNPLPQTGVLWWPVPVQLCAGALFITAGILRRRGLNRE